MLLVLTACAGNSPAPVVERRQPPANRVSSHTVAAGETLYSIAWSYGMDWRRLAALNAIASPYVIRVGQRLRLSGPLPPARAAAQQPAPAPPPVAQRSQSAPRQAAKPAAAHPAPAGAWRWPAQGAVVKAFAAGAQPHKGIDLAGRSGDPVLAANNGVVVYAGDGIRGYGNLLIVKHSNGYLSAYAHNRRLLVGEGTAVTAGQRIAEIGDSGTDSVKLHFEVRRHGKPMNPITVLPAR